VDPELDERALRSLLEAGRSLVSDLELEAVLERLLAAAAEITGARYAALGVLGEDRSALESFIYTGIDDRTRRRIGDLPRGRGVLGVLIDDPRPLRLDDVAAHPDSFGFPEEHPPMHTFLGVPISVRGEPWGNLYLTEKQGGDPFDETDEAVTVVLSEWAGIAIANARSVAAERLRTSMEAAEQERLQWARELHDETLQGLAAIRMVLATGRRSGGERLEAASDQALAQIDSEIAAMRALITDLRPDSLERLGVGAALEGLGQRIEARSPSVAIEIANGLDRARRPDASIEVAIYRIAQEAITNAIRHGHARRITVEIGAEAGGVVAVVTDDGEGFDPGSADLGFGIMGMRERAELCGATLRIESRPGSGAVVEVRAPFEGGR
jgi:signal transduction histidine kinase